MLRFSRHHQVSDRERKLDAALLQSGQFKDALQSLLTWLSDTEDLVQNNVKPLAADYKVLKTQMQEHKVRRRATHGSTLNQKFKLYIGYMYMW